MLGPSRFFQASVDSSHRRNVFGRDAEVEHVDFVLSIRNGVDGDVVAVG